jgi:hypothetical protein
VSWLGELLLLLLLLLLLSLNSFPTSNNKHYGDLLVK